MDAKVERAVQSCMLKNFFLHEIYGRQKNILKKKQEKKMNPTELQQNMLQAILYYCGVTQSDATRFFTDDFPSLSVNIGTLDVDGNGDLFVDTWLLGYAKPDNTTLAEPTLAAVSTFYTNAYLNPWSIMNTQCYPKFNSTQIGAMETDNLTVGDIIRNSTTQKLQHWSGSAWVDLW